MSIKDILLAVLLIFNVYFAYAIYDLNQEKKEATVIVEVDPHVEKYSEIDYNDYATLYMFKQILPTDIFEEMLLPEIEIALKDRTINENEWMGIQQKIQDLENTGKIDFYKFYIAQMQEKDLSTTIEQIFEDLGGKASDLTKDFTENLKEDLQTLGEDLGNEASELSKDIKEGFEDFVEENKDLLKDKDMEPAPILIQELNPQESEQDKSKLEELQTTPNTDDVTSL